ncbi:hypothetical protein LINGRAPRIM_LOCUS2323, partial [Linum grandiflorum]
RLLENIDCLLAKILRAKYHPFDHFLGVVAGLRLSWGWRSLLYGRELLMKGLRWQIGNGQSVPIIRDLWVLGVDPERPVPQPPFPYAGPRFVSDFIKDGR